MWDTQKTDSCWCKKKERRKLLLGLCVPSPQSCGELQMFDSQHGAVHCRGCICNIKNLVDEVWRIDSLVIVRSIDQWSHQDGPQETLSVLSLKTFWINKRPIFWTQKNIPTQKTRLPADKLQNWIHGCSSAKVQKVWPLSWPRRWESSMDMSFMSFISNQKHTLDHSWVLRLWFP